MDEFLLNREPTAQVDNTLDTEARAAIERDKLDPRQQMYMYNKTAKLLIRTTAQYHHAIENHHELKYVDYRQAEAIFKQEEALKRKALAKVAARKRSKQARKRSRGS